MKEIVCRKKENRVISLISVLLLSFLCLTVTSASATGNIGSSVESSVEQYNTPQPYYVTESRSYKVSEHVVPPMTIHHSEMIGGVSFRIF